MDFLSGYDDEGAVDVNVEVESNSSSLKALYSDMTTLTNVSGQLISFNSAPSALVPVGMNLVPFNAENQSILNTPGEVLGPINPYKNQFGTKPMKAEAAAIDDWTFNQQYENYQRSGYAIDSETNNILGDYDAYLKDEKTVPLPKEPKNKRTKLSKIQDILKDEKLLTEDNDDDGPWISMPKPSVDEFIATVELFNSDLNANKTSSIAVATSSVPNHGIIKKPTLSLEDNEEKYKEMKMFIVEPDEEDEKWERVSERKIGFSLPPRPPRGSIANEATTTFHGAGEVDYQGRSWITPPSGIKPYVGIGVDDCINTYSDHNCFIPKKCIKKYTGHNKGVQVIEFFPKTGHLLLSASLDGKCKVWDVYNDRNVKRTYVGHSEAVRSACFDHTGTQFLSSAFDRYVRLWDTETGQVKGTFSNRKMAYQVKFHPRENNMFIAPSSDNKIYQWDTRTGNIVQEYNHHLQPVNAVVFFDDGKKFVSSSDDKKLLVWEFDIPVPIKYIQDPEMFSIPFLTTHPTGQFIVGQSMDNSIPTYVCGESVKPARKRIFRGHNNSGYACQIGFSPNGKYMISGDGFGKLYFWEWKTMMMTRKFQAHDNGPCMGAAWHPVHKSWVATCGWDGLIKLWE